MLAAIAPVTVVALDGNDPALRLCEVLIQALDGAWSSAFRQIVYAPFLRAVHHTRGHLGVVWVGGATVEKGEDEGVGDKVRCSVSDTSFSAHEQRDWRCYVRRWGLRESRWQWREKA